jgi:hypothetical protein
MTKKSADTGTLLKQTYLTRAEVDAQVPQVIQALVDANAHVIGKGFGPLK